MKSSAVLKPPWALERWIRNRICRWRSGRLTRCRRRRLAEQHKTQAAIQLLQTALRTWRGTSITDRLQKNINVLTLQGKPAPLLRETEWIGAKPAALAALRGKVVLLFFWAHWCADCKAEGPVIAKLASELAPQRPGRDCSDETLRLHGGRRPRARFQGNQFYREGLFEILFEYSQCGRSGGHRATSSASA